LECPICLGACNKFSSFVDARGETVESCRKCFRKATGLDSRIELQYSEYLDENFGTDYLIGSDQRVYGAACQRYRPDKLYASPEMVLHVEIDEHQHLYSNGSYSCEEKRISDIYNEFPGKKYVVVRVNPHAFAFPDAHPTKRKAKQVERMKLTLQVMRHVATHPFESQIHIVYLFYSADNPKLAQRIPKTMLYDMNDIKRFTSQTLKRPRESGAEERATKRAAAAI
jgi:hypothetical protein